MKWCEDYIEQHTILNILKSVGVLVGEQLLTAPFAGYLADRFRRDAVLRVAAAIGLVAGLTLAAGLYFEGPIWHFVLAMGLMGSYRGFNNPAVESIFADSIQTGKR